MSDAESTKKKKGLGRGLGSLLGEEALESVEHNGPLKLPLSQVQPAADQPRKHFDQESLAELSQSITQHGILQPITVRRLDSGYYEIIAGERRWRAARLAGLSHVPVNVVEADDKTTMELALIENLQREDLNPMEEAAGLQTLIEQYGLTQEEAAGRVGKSRPAVTNALRLLALPQEIQWLIEQGSLSAGHGRALLTLSTAEQMALAEQIVRQNLSVRQTEELVRRREKQGEDKPAVQSEKPGALYLKEAERNLSEQLGRRVVISQGKKKGRIFLEYYDAEDLEVLLTQLGRDEQKG